MELKDFAESILFGNNIISNKLLIPDELTDVKEYQAIVAPKQPGRPKFLEFNNILLKKKISFPNQEKLYDAKQRGYVLHFFANHELLAMEIMALVLLLFPSAPKKFRMGVANTILEEQKHMSLYIQRMEQLGVEFGEIQVNNFFWNCLSQMNSPFEFITKMSMTFEQANIDYSKFYKNLMIKCNDFETANILETVYQEEIGHVKHGVYWFNQWRNSAESEWDSYVNSLKFPLSPARAKGLIFDVDARKSIGFSDEYISKLSIFSASKGRPPNIYYFNPACEFEISRGSIGFTPNKSMQNLQHDCASLMQFIASKDDIVLISKIPNVSFLKKIQSCGFILPEWVEYNKNSINVNSVLQNYIGYIFPWGWSPESINLINIFSTKLIGKSIFHKNIFQNYFYEKQIKHLYSKVYSTELIYKIQKYFKNIQDILSQENTLPSVANCLESAIVHIEKYLSNSEIQTVVLKAPFGCSGMNMRRVNSVKLNISELNWLNRILKSDKFIIIEPWYEKVADFSYQSKITEQGLTVPLGMTRFVTNDQGQYKATIISKKSDYLSSDVVKFIHNRYENYYGIEEILQETSNIVASFLKENFFEGPFGLDAFIYKDINSKYGYRLKVISEINPRITMGRVALEISKRIQTGVFAIWVHIRIKEIKAYFSSIEDFCLFVETQFPIKYSNTVNQLIREGVLFTTDPYIAKSILTVLIVGKEIFEKFEKYTSVKIIY